MFSHFFILMMILSLRNYHDGPAERPAQEASVENRLEAAANPVTSLNVATLHHPVMSLMDVNSHMPVYSCNANRREKLY